MSSSEILTEENHICLDFFFDLVHVQGQALTQLSLLISSTFGGITEISNYNHMFNQLILVQDGDIFL